MSYHDVHECADCKRPFETERRNATICHECSAKRVASVIAANGDGDDGDILMIDLDGRPIGREVPHRGNWSGDIRKPVGASRVRRPRWWQR